MKNVFVETMNARNFITTMTEAKRMAGEPLLLAFYGPAGRGKTETARFFAAQEGWTYCRCGKGWQKSELWMLQDLCFELMIDPIPKRKKPCFEAIVENLRAHSGTVIIDEADKMPKESLEWIRDFVDLTAAPFALIGEKLLKYKMEAERRIWSRTLRLIEFEPVSSKDILFFAKKAADLTLGAQQADKMQQAAEGDFRPVKRHVFFIEELMRINRTDRITDEMVDIAIKKEQKERKSKAGK